MQKEREREREIGVVYVLVRAVVMIQTLLKRVEASLIITFFTFSSKKLYGLDVGISNIIR